MNAAAWESLGKVFTQLKIDHGAKDSAQCKCLTKYLGELECASFVIEKEYVDSGYLADYAGYYALCHDTPEKLTTRLHFFQLPPADVDAAWHKAIDSRKDVEEVQKKLNAAYLGFIVIKPLPATVIGKTCLRIYPEHDVETGRDRFFPIRRHYIVGLWGLSLSVDTVAFQEQDREIAACSTAAIWSAMHAMPPWFTVHEIPSPFQITSSGWDGRLMPMEGETAARFPSNGMDVKQIVGCLRQYGIETAVLGLPINGGCTKLLDNITAYLGAGTPILLVGTLYAKRNGEPFFTRRGLHAATVLGYSYPPAFKEAGWVDRVQRLYIHDDTLGPFASFAIERCDAGKFGTALGYTGTLGAPAMSVAEGQVTEYLANTSGAHVGVSTFVLPNYIIIPINTKQHLPYSTVRDFIDQLYSWYCKWAPGVYGKTPVPKLSWTVRLVDQVAFKNRMLKNADWLKDQKEPILQASLPRLLWTVEITALVGKTEKQATILVLDATSLQQGGAVCHALIGEEAIAETVFSIWLRCAEQYARSKAAGHKLLEPMDSNLEACVMKLRDVLKKMMKRPAPAAAKA